MKKLSEFTLQNLQRSIGKEVVSQLSSNWGKILDVSDYGSVDIAWNNGNVAYGSWISKCDYIWVRE